MRILEYPLSGITLRNSGAGTAYPSGTLDLISGIKWGSCYSIFCCMCMFCRSMLVLLSFFIWSLCCLFYF